MKWRMISEVTMFMEAVGNPKLVSLTAEYPAIYLHVIE